MADELRETKTSEERRQGHVANTDLPLEIEERSLLDVWGADFTAPSYWTHDDIEQWKELAQNHDMEVVSLLEFSYYAAKIISGEAELDSINNLESLTLPERIESMEQLVAEEKKSRRLAYEHLHGEQSLDSTVNRQETKVLSSGEIDPPPVEENVAAAKKTVKASEIFKDFEEGMIFAGISHKEFDRAMLGYLHQRSGREEAGNGTFDTQAMFELLVVQKIHDARTRAFVFGKIGQYEGMTVEFDADNIDLGYLRLSDREGAEEVRKDLEELKAAHPILVRNLAGRDEPVAKAEQNPFLAADPEQVQELQEQAEAVEKMQQEAASNIEFDGDGNPYYPKSEAAEENAHPVTEKESREYWKDKFVNGNPETFKMLDDFLNRGIKQKNDEFIFPNVPEILKFAGVSENEIVIKTSVINKARHEHSLSTKEIRETIENIASPVLIFASDKNSTENKKDSYLSLTDTFAENGKPIAFSMNLDSDFMRGRTVLSVNQITSIHDRTLIAKNGTDLIRKWTEEGNCRYVDDKKIADWQLAAGVQFPLAVLQSDNNTIPTRSGFVKQWTEKEKLEASAGKDAASAQIAPSAEHFDPAAPVVYGKTVLPSFAVMADGKLQSVENAVVTSFDKKQNAYLIDTGTERMALPAETFKTLLDDRHGQERGQAKVAEGRTIVFEDSDRGVRGTVIPEFAMYTQRGLESFKGFVATKFNAAENTYTLRNEDTSLVVTAERFKEITAPGRFENHFDENSPAWKKLCETQYDDFFKQRSNTAYNFRHNLSVYCRREANSPCDALHLARQIIRQMPNDEQRRTQRLLQGMSHENESMNEFIARLYHEAIKEMPLNEDYIKKYRPEKVIARPFYDTVSENGSKIENDPALVKGNTDRNLRIGDTLRNVDIQTGNLFGRGRDVMHFDALKVVSASKEGNSVTLMDAEKSFIKLPRDTVLSFYKTQQLHEMKREQRQNRSNKMTIGYV